MKFFEKLLIISASLVFGFFAATGVYAGQKPLELNYPKLPGLPALTIDTTLPDLINYLFVLSLALAGILAFVSLVIAGFSFIISGANPGLRVMAKKRVAQVFTGVLTLLGTYIILNTINPDLTLVTQSGISLIISQIPAINEPAGLFGAPPNLETMRYGGGVLYENPDGIITGTGRSETVLHDIANFNSGSDMIGVQISNIKIMGNCEVKLTPDSGPLQVVSSPGKILNPPLTLQSLDFLKSDCLGYSIKLFSETDFNSNVGIGFNTHFTFIDSSADFSKVKGRNFQKGKSANDMAKSLRVAKATTNPEEFAFQICIDADYKNCSGILNWVNIPNLETVTYDDKNGVPLGNLSEEASSMQISSSNFRQAGVVLYSNKDFTDTYEILISSDFDLEDGNVIGKTATGKPTLDSLKIIGKYRVQLCDKEEKCIVINTIADEPCIISDGTGENTDNLGSSRYRSVAPGYVVQTQPIPADILKDGSVYIPDLDNKELFCRKYEKDDPAKPCEKTWGDSVKQIVIEMLVETQFEKGIPSLINGPFEPKNECGSKKVYAPI